MRIAHALSMPVLRQGGLEVLVRSLISDAPAGDAIFLVSQDTSGDLESCGWQSRLSGHLQVPVGRIQGSWNRELLHWLKDHQIEVCHFHLSGTYGWGTRFLMGCPITAVARAGIPTVTTNHSATCFFIDTGAQRPTWRKWAAAAKAWPGKALQLLSVRWEASVSQHDLAVSRRYFPFFHSKLIQVYHSRIDAEFPTTPPQQTRTILNVGTIAYHKGQHLLVEAFAKVATDFPDWQLKLVGYVAEAACEEQIRSTAQIRGLQDRIHLCAPDSNPNHFFQDAEIYVQPSLVEGLGLSLQEAMFHGRACIGSSIGGIPELIIDPSVGLLFPGGDIASLATALAQLMSNPDQRSRLGAAARSSILERGMTRQAMSANYRTLYQQTIHLK